jgi:hypothetical protein
LIKRLSENLYFRKDQLSEGQMREGKVIRLFFLPTNEEPTRTIDPGMGSLHHPAVWQMTKAFGPFKQAVIDLLAGEDPRAARTAGMADHLYLPPHVLFDPGAPGSCVGIVDPDFLSTGKLAFDWLQKQWDALSILQLGVMHHHFQQQAQVSTSR